VRAAGVAWRAVTFLLLAGCHPQRRIEVAPAATAAHDTTSHESTRPIGTSGASRRGRRFYAGRAYGSESQFNPLSLVVNGGFDQLRTVGAEKRLTRRPYAAPASNVWYSITRPDRVVRQYGVRRWLRNEVFPLTGKGSGGGQWVPNYQLHLLGGGMTSARMTEWYEQHGAPHPALLSTGTVFAWHFLTETVENGGRKRLDADAMTDLLIFDVGSVLAFRSERVQRFFGETLEMTNWSGQPSIAAPNGTIENVHQTTLLRAPLPRTRDWRAMTTFGGAFLLGVSRRRGERDWLSVAGGWDPADNPVIDPVTGRKTVTLLPNAALFWDRESSLMAALSIRWRRPEVATLNLYPGVVRLPGWSPGLWVQLLDRGGARVGLVSPVGLGIARAPR
jgi:hypothetical protein